MQRFVYHLRLGRSDSATQLKLTVLGDLAVQEKAFIFKCAGMQLKHTAGELVWSPKGGWGIVKTTQRDGKVDVYVAKGDDVRTFRAHGWLVSAGSREGG